MEKKDKLKFIKLIFIIFIIIATGAVFNFNYDFSGNKEIYANESYWNLFSNLSNILGREELNRLLPQYCDNTPEQDVIRRNTPLLLKIENRISPPAPPPPSFGVFRGGVSQNITSNIASLKQNITINNGDVITMSWSCVDSNSSSGLNFSTGGAVSGLVSINPSITTTYTAVCANGGQASVAVTVLHPELEITAVPAQVRAGRQSLITWSATNVDTCGIAGANGFSDTGLSGSKMSGPINQQSIFILSCVNVAGTIEKSAVVLLIPSFDEF